MAVPARHRARPGRARILALLAPLLLPACTARPVAEELMVPMRDGVRLETRVWRPPGPGRWPVVLSRGYGPGSEREASAFVAAGYAYVGQAERGHGRSERPQAQGERFLHSARDGWDCLEWLRRQPWCDGSVAMYGKSYYGATQWLLAPLQHPSLKAIVPQNIAADLWRQGYRSHGALTLAMAAAGRAYTDDRQARRYGWERLYRFLPLIDLDREVSGREDPLWNAYVAHATFDDYWRAISLADLGQVRVPVYLMGGWYDYYAGAALQGFAALRALGAASDVRVVIDASDHLNRAPAGRAFGRAAVKDELRLAIRWLDWVVKGRDDGVSAEPPVRLFVMGVNEWRSAGDWPLPGTRFVPHYLSAPAGGRVGRLALSPPADEPPSRYTYDPRDPVPTRGGGHSFLGGDGNDLAPVGSFDHRANAARPDVLVFETEPLAADTEVIGPVEVHLHASSSAPDTDFTAMLLDVAADGTAWNLSEGILRARFWKSIYQPPELLEPGRVYQLRIELQPTANVFRRGHRIALHLSSSNFPLWDRNPNTGHDQGMDAELRPADQAVFHDRSRPSHLLLPLAPAAGSAGAAVVEPAVRR